MKKVKCKIFLFFLVMFTLAPSIYAIDDYYQISIHSKFFSKLLVDLTSFLFGYSRVEFVLFNEAINLSNYTVEKIPISVMGQLDIGRVSGTD